MDILNWIYLKRQQLIKRTLNNPETDLVVLGAQVPFSKRDDGYQTYAMTVDDFASSARGYKNYIALINQTDTDPPVATVLENTLGVTATYDYDGPGLYYITFDQALFTNQNSYITISQSTYVNGANDICITQAGAVFFNVLELTSYAATVPANDVIGGSAPCILEVRVYN
jgi:hypothetical protein